MNATDTPPKRKKEVILTKTPSKLIRLALSDLKKCEANPKKFKIDMSNWVTFNSHCTVCLAGAVLVKRCESIRSLRERTRAYRFGSKQFVPQQALPTNNYMQLLALNCFRTGAVSAGCYYLNVKTQLPLQCKVTPYEVDPQAFHRDMLKLADRLAAEGN